MPTRLDAESAAHRPLQVLTIVGTRPEVIKMAPVIRALEDTDGVHARVCAIGQHREMLQQALDVFGIVPDYERNVMRPNQSLAALTAVLTQEIDAVVDQCGPDWILAQGDTTTVMVAALIAFYRGIRFGHVEAGLRTGDLDRPFPEELNRRVADLVASAYFAPTTRAAETLRREGVDPRRIHVTGNTIVDALHEVAGRAYNWTSGPLRSVNPDRPLVLITAHRRESFGGPFRQLCQAIADLAARFAYVQFVYPVHLNPNVREPVFDLLGSRNNVFLLEPLDYVSLVQLMRRSQVVLTDSGGIQEEAPSFGVPVLVMRETTERPEGLATGLVQLVGTDRRRIVDGATAVLSACRETRGELRPSPYGDGHAAARIVAAITHVDPAIPAALEASSRV